VGMRMCNMEVWVCPQKTAQVPFSIFWCLVACEVATRHECSAVECCVSNIEKGKQTCDGGVVAFKVKVENCS